MKRDNNFLLTFRLTLLLIFPCFRTQVDNEMKKKIKAWEDENETYFMIKGMRYADYLEHQKLDYETETKLKKDEKARMKKVELSQEVQFGSRSKRRCPGTPGKLGVSKLARVRTKVFSDFVFYRLYSRYKFLQ